MTLGADESAAPATMASGGMVAQELDFEHRRWGSLAPSEIGETLSRGGFAWIDIDVADARAAARLLDGLAPLASVDVPALLAGPATASLVRHEGHLELVLPTAPAAGGGAEPGRVCVAAAERFLLSAHIGAAGTMTAARRQAEADFATHARTPGFLLYEIVAQVIDGHREDIREVEERLHRLQVELREPATPATLAAVAEIDAGLVRLRRTLLDLRDVLDELATRRSTLVSESTQPYLAGQAVTLDRLAGDALAGREVAASMLTLYVATASSRAGRALGRLTGITVIFLPMLFTVQLIRADLDWASPWSALWGLAILFAGSVILYMRRNRLL